MSSSVLECFPKLLSDNPHDRLNGGLKLLQHLLKQEQENGESKELNHILRRLVRGLGASKISSRKGFYSTLTVYLLLNPNSKFEKILSIMNEELKTSNSNTKSEFADINNGRILACGAMIRSQILKTCSVDEQKKVLECLLHSGKQRSYLNFNAVSFIVQFLNQFENKESVVPIWPVLEQAICQPFVEHTLDTFYLLLIVVNKFPGLINKKTLKKCFGNENIINEKSINDILKILTDIPRISCHKHPVYNIFCKKLIETDYLEQFWMSIDQRFVKPSKTDEYLGSELFNILLEIISNKSIIPTLLSSNFLKYMLKRFSNSGKHKVDDVACSFKKALLQLPKLLDKEVKSKLQISILKKLILYPGDLMIEKITGTKVIQMMTSNLNADGVRKLAILYRQIAANTKFKEKANSVTEPWTNGERTYAMQLLSVKLMNHPEIVSDHEWRIEQLKFLFNHGLCEVSNVGVELVSHFKESFYRALDNKLPKLEDLRTVLSSLISYINEIIFESSEMKLRSPLDEAGTEAWRKMMKLVKKLEKDKNNENINAVFHTMNLHMGLQLFSDPEMAISSINELHSCLEHFRAKKKSNKENISITDNEEPEWVEVVVDLLLSLLSRKSHLLRSLVGCVFPHICPHLTPNAVHQILAILDVKSGKNPLTTKNNGDSESESEPEDEDENENDEEDENEEEENNSNAEDNDIEEESDSDIEESEVEDETVTDRLRLAVRQALGDVSMQTDDEDIDVDKIDEEEGKRLDESLAAAFRILKENRKSQSKKQEKSAQALTHFRIRVVDVLEIYLETNPSMALALDMLVPLFTLLEFSIKNPHQEPLENKVRSCLKKLSGVKKFKTVEGVDEELLTTVLRALIEKGERSTSICQEMGSKLAECCIFLVRCSQQANISTDSFIQILGENLTAFFKKRDCVLPDILFKNLFQLCWVGNWNLAPLLVQFAFDESTRFYRKGKALEFLKVFYNNSRMITSENFKNKRLEIEKKLCEQSINILCEWSKPKGIDKSVANAGKVLKQKYVFQLFTLLKVIYVHHMPEAWNWKKIGESMSNYRSTASLAKDAKSAFNKLAIRIGVPVIFQKNQNVEKTEFINGNGDSESKEVMSDDNESVNNNESNASEKSSKKNDKKRKKKNSKQNEKQKLKKETGELRAKLMSEGLESLSFSSVNISNGVSEEPIPNGDLNEVEVQKVKKRPNSEVVGVPSKKKKKTVKSGD